MVHRAWALPRRITMLGNNFNKKLDQLSALQNSLSLPDVRRVLARTPLLHNVFPRLGTTTSATATKRHPIRSQFSDARSKNPKRA